MIFFAGNDGTIIKSIPEQVYQGGAGANTIYLIAPFASTMNVTVAFKLPTGVWKQRYDMTPVNEIEGIINAKTGEKYSGWKYDLPNEITLNYGTVGAQFFFYSALTGKITASSYASFAVGAGVPEVMPEQMPVNVYDLIRSNITGIQQQLASGGTTARSFFPWNSAYTYNAGEIVYYPEQGQYGTFVKSLADNNTSEPYADGAIDGDEWEEVVNFDILNNLYGLQGELEEGVKQAADSAASAERSAGAAEAQAIAASVSAENAAASAKAAEEAVGQFKGVADWAEEVQGGTVSVPKAEQAENDGLGHNIHEHFTSVESDIEGLREQITEEGHFRGYLATNAEIEALSGTPNDFAYSAESGTVWIYQTATGWTDSGKPVPDQVIPKGTATPLMDGAAQVGNSNTYADALHRHPTDTTRASQTALNNEITRAQQEEAKKANLSGATFTGSITAPQITGSNGVYDGNSRVYSPDNPPPSSEVVPDGDYPNMTAGNADKLSSARNIDGVAFDGSNSIAHYGVCGTASATAAKTVTLAGFARVQGARISVKFTYTNTAAAPTLNVNGTGAAAIHDSGSGLSQYTYIWSAGEVVGFVFDGTYWMIQKPAMATATYPGVSKVASVNLNGNNNANPSFYAPVGAGTKNDILRSNGYGAPEWTDPQAATLLYSTVNLTTGTKTLSQSLDNFTKVLIKIGFDGTDRWVSAYMPVSSFKLFTGNQKLVLATESHFGMITYASATTVNVPNKNNEANSLYIYGLLG